MTAYQIVAECAHVTVDTPQGPTVMLLYKGAVISDSAPQLRHLLDNGFVVKVGGDETGGLDSAGIPAGAYDAEVPSGLTTTPVEKTEEQKRVEAEADAKAKADAEVAERRAAAQAKLPADGSAPHANAGEPVWVEYAVKQGVDRNEAQAAGKEELRKLFANK